MIKKYFTLSIVFSICFLSIAFITGYYVGNKAGYYFITVLLLGIMEVAVSLDNAVVNALVLKYMDAKWRAIFLTWGMVVAVFGMRLAAPLAIVSIAGAISPSDAIHVALFQPARYQALLTSVHLQVMAFGGAFLLMVFASHFIDKEKDQHWIPVIGHLMARIGRHGTSRFFVPILIILIFSKFVGNKDFLIAGMWGIIAYLMLDGVEELFKVAGVATTAARTGLAGFLYLEVLDASFSFDGVIAAFAISNNFFIIMLGLSIGAMFVRSLTLMMVERQTLDNLCYVEDGAFWGIGWLVVAMLLSALGIQLSEFLVAGGAVGAISAAAIHSIVINNKNKK